jgi:ABC-type nitrate/sulfonate/bicarbonate transport system ATPase subunit
MNLVRAYFAFESSPSPIIDIEHGDLSWSGLASLSGPSGSGKTTLFRLLSGWYDSPGTICVFSPSINIYRDVRFIGAHDSLLPWKSVRDNLAFRGIPAEKTEAALERLGLATDSASKAVYELSYGMYKRVELAIAIVERPILLLLDEFFSSLDDLTKTLIRDHIEAYRGNDKTWVIAHEQSVRQWLTHNRFCLVLEDKTRCVIGIAESQ